RTRKAISLPRVSTSSDFEFISHYVDQRRFAAFGAVIIVDQLHRRADLAADRALRQVTLRLLAQTDFVGLRSADKKHLGTALADLFQLLRADFLRGLAVADGELLAPRLHLAGHLDIDVAIERLFAHHDFPEAEPGDFRVGRLDAVLLLERAAA